MDTVIELPREQVNGWYMARQRLGLRAPLSFLSHLLSEIGWLYSPPDATPYLAIRARIGDYSTAELDRLIFEEHGLIEVNGVRGEQMLIPRQHLHLVRLISDRPCTRRLEQARRLVGLTPQDTLRLQEDILSLLRRLGPLNERGLRNHLPAGRIKPWGEVGLRKLGSPDSLRDTLGQMIEQGTVVRLKADKRLDSVSYLYYRAKDVLPEDTVWQEEMDAAAAWQRLAKYYFEWYGPARLEDFIWWSGLTMEQARAAVANVTPELMPLTIQGLPDVYLASDWTLRAISTFRLLSEPMIAFIPARDPYHANFCKVTGRFLHPHHRLKAMPRWRGKPLGDPHTVAVILLDGEIGGVWEWSPEQQAVDWLLFEPPTPAIEVTVQKEADTLSEFIRREKIPPNGTLGRPPLHLASPDMVYRIRELARLADSADDGLQEPMGHET